MIEGSRALIDGQFWDCGGRRRPIEFSPKITQLASGRARITPQVIEGLVRNLDDPTQIVRIATMRAASRLAAMEVVPSGLRNEIVGSVATRLPTHRRGDVLGATFLPSPEVLLEIKDLLPTFGQLDRERAYSVIREIADKTEAASPLTLKRERNKESANHRISRLITAPADAYINIGAEIPWVQLETAEPVLASDLVTSLFARLNMPSYDEHHERLVEAENVSKIVSELGSKFKPDVPGLLAVYESFLPQATDFWLQWLAKLHADGYDLHKAMPLWFPLTEGPLAVTRQIEWTLSRPGMRTLLEGLKKPLQSSSARDRWAAAQLIEGATRYATTKHPPSFGGGSGPDDILPAELNRFHIEGIEDIRFAHTNVAGDLTGAGSAAHKEPARYTDLTLFSGHLYPGDAPEQSSRIAEEVALVPGEPYTLEVAIRLERTGIDAPREAVRAVINPRQDKEELKIYVLANSLRPEIEIPQPFVSIKWPWNKDSEPAFFRLEVKRPVTGHVAQNQIEVRLYDGSLDLLDIVRLSVTVAGATEEIPAGHKKQSLTWCDISGGDLRIAPRTPPRLLSIDVGLSAASGHYRLFFKFLANNGESVSIPGSSYIAPEDLENLLGDVRDLWTEMVIANYASDLTVTAATFGHYLAELRSLGVRAWRLLFGDRFARIIGAPALGDLLAAMHTREGAHVQITYSGIEDFVFPWSIVYPPDGGSEADPYQFWGARYRIEQVSAGPKDDVLSDEPVRIALALDPQFANSDAQTELLHGYESAAGGKLHVGDSLCDKDKLFSGLSEDPSAHLYYFYCHGYAPAGKGVLRRDGVKLLREKIEALDDDAPAREALETLLTLTGKMKTEPWIYIGNAEIKESQIRDRDFFWKRRPIVFLNACQSAELVPSSTSGFVRVFLDRNASAVIGTESPMTSVFASAFAKVLFDELLRGGDIGTALWKARRQFLSGDMRNPLGLAYTLYGRGTARVGSGPMILGPVEESQFPFVRRETHG